MHVFTGLLVKEHKKNVNVEQLQLIIQLTYFKICRIMYRVINNITWGKYDYGTILQLIILLTYLKICMFIYRKINNFIRGKYEYGTILQLII